ncbi:hypothetical protein B4O97_00870 [Marispirochaeta aestuarii]|uniref:GmrSD restriction endonucleases N-terminal domain-containing protein n=1 Tax=Marispirochaeta aestuarii TaxID=1963862 RepID=A0A1Y1S2Z0_9SPIO|nr:DUF262 domain-containing protein [Marispirochaeta aestuarii]ORC38341.1 hypothetical protein B4O97_00870 [Marispirochaeta aestuarii]
MSYHKMSLYDAISEIEGGRMFLPALQRRFVWGKGQIELLFDSIMRGYPFGTFLFWKLDKKNANNYVFYEFNRFYDERTPFNDRKVGAFTPDKITGVLDGQQRLSSIYIGLQGTHTEKGYRKRSSSPDAYKKTYLYLNLLSLPYRQNIDGGLEQDEQRNFEFRFLTTAAVNSHTMRQTQDNPTNKEHMCWFRVGEIMEWPKDPDIDHYIDQVAISCVDSSQAEALRGARRFVRKGLADLNKRVREEPLINYFEVSKDDLEDILKIFVRVNSGGTVLSKTDLLFSTIVATWDNGREEIETIQKTINGLGQGFGFGTEYLMRCCLVLSDGPVLYKVHSFKAENVQTIREQWQKIAKAIVRTVELLVEFGFSKETLTSNNATIPIVYYIYKGGSLDKKSRNELRLYLVHALLKQVFGSSQDQLLSKIRNTLRADARQSDGFYPLRDTYKTFDFRCFADVQLPGGKSLKVTAEDVNRFIEYRKGPAAFAVLQLLYPQLRYGENSFHQDHIHPASKFCREEFEAMGINSEQYAQWWEWRDQVPNLQLMEGSQNQSKNATPLKDWLQRMSNREREHFITSNYFPEELKLAFDDFPEFFNARREILREELGNLLYIADAFDTTTEDDDEIDRLRDEDVEEAVFEGQPRDGLT